MALGVAIGSIIAFVSNTGYWIAIGLALGAGIGNRIDKNEGNNKNY